MRQYSHRCDARCSTASSRSRRVLMWGGDREVVAPPLERATNARLIPPAIPTLRARPQRVLPHYYDPSTAGDDRPPCSADAAVRWSQPIRRERQSSYSSPYLGELRTADQRACVKLSIASCHCPAKVRFVVPDSELNYIQATTTAGSREEADPYCSHRHHPVYIIECSCDPV